MRYPESTPDKWVEFPGKPGKFVEFPGKPRRFDPDTSGDDPL